MKKGVDMERDRYSRTDPEIRNAMQDVFRHTVLTLLPIPYGPLRPSTRSLDFAFENRLSFANPCVAVDILSPILYISDRTGDIIAELRDAK